MYVCIHIYIYIYIYIHTYMYIYNYYISIYYTRFTKQHVVTAVVLQSACPMHNSKETGLG